MADIATLVLESISKVQTLGINWYHATVSWNDLPRKVERLEAECGRWRVKMIEFGLSLNPPVGLAASFNELKRRFDEEHAELERRRAEENSCCRWRAVLHKWYMTVFPVSLGEYVDEVTVAIETLVASLQTEVAIHETFEKYAAQTISSLRFRMDACYVHLSDLESEIFSLLDDPQGPRLILLHGGPGKGKSTLARYIALRRSEDTDYPVIYLECGSRVETLAKQVELLERLGSDMATSSRMSGEPVRKQLIFRLREQKMIIVLDDVDDREFLQGMVGLCGTNVTCLVTSQRGDLCRGVNVIDSRYKIIDMGDISKDNAKKMLAAHSAFLNHEIPSHLEAIAEEILGKVGENPLAITTIATAIDIARHEEIEEWAAASKHVLKLLHEEESLPYTFDNKYPRSYWASMQLLFKSLNEDEKRLLILVHMCQAPSVPEEIVVFLYTRISGCQEYIPRLRKELESRHLVQIREALEGTRKQRSWSVLSLQRTFVNEEANDDMEQMFMSLRGQSSSNTDSIHADLGTESMTEEEGVLGTTLDSEFKSTVAAMYLDEDFARRMASDMNVNVSRFSDGTKRPFIEPIVRLIVRESSRLRGSNIWDQARKVFVGYMCGRQEDGVINGVIIDDDFIRTLYGPSEISNRMVTYVKRRLCDNLRVSQDAIRYAIVPRQRSPNKMVDYKRHHRVSQDAIVPRQRGRKKQRERQDAPAFEPRLKFIFVKRRPENDTCISHAKPYTFTSGEEHLPWSTYLDYEVDSLFGFFQI